MFDRGIIREIMLKILFFKQIIQYSDITPEGYIKFR
ncbi:hypothetical protein T08_4289 [Trichinella sp. T8]|nr:hypothetical protein T08_4289 [Trichinella sp. T8]